MLTEPIDVSRAPPVLQDDVRAFDIPQLTETLHESLAAGGTGAGRDGEIRYPGDCPGPLRFGGERHQEESEGEGDEARDGAAPRGGLAPLASCRPSMTVDTAEMRAHDPLLAVQNTPLLFVFSTAEEAERCASGAAVSRRLHAGVRQRSFDDFSCCCHAAAKTNGRC